MMDYIYYNMQGLGDLSSLPWERGIQMCRARSYRRLSFALTLLPATRAMAQKPVDHSASIRSSDLIALPLYAAGLWPGGVDSATGFTSFQGVANGGGTFDPYVNSRKMVLFR